MRVAVFVALCALMAGCGGIEPSPTGVKVTCASGKECVGPVEHCVATCNASVPSADTAEPNEDNVTALGNVKVTCPGGGTCEGSAQDCAAFCNAT